MRLQIKYKSQRYPRRLPASLVGPVSECELVCCQHEVHIAGHSLVVIVVTLVDYHGKIVEGKGNEGSVHQNSDPRQNF